MGGKSSSRNYCASTFFLFLSIFEIVEVGYIMFSKDGEDKFLPLWIVLVILSFVADCFFEFKVSNPIGRAFGEFVSNLICGLLPFFIVGWSKVESCLSITQSEPKECSNIEGIFLGLSIAVIVLHFLRFVWNLCCDNDSCDDSIECCC
eukprot:TCONS_00033153-protein